MRISRPGLVRSLPFGLFLLLLLVRQQLQGRTDGAFDLRLLYPLKTVLVGGLLVYLYREYTELRQSPRSGTWLWLWAPMVGAVVFVLWVNLDRGWLNLGTGGFVYDPRDPHTGRILWGLAAFRLGGSALVVPVMEELFWRSFIMRWIDKHDFLDLSPAVVSLKAVAISCFLFGVEHHLWFAGILAGLAYAWLYRASGSLWPAIIAHGVTNLMLGVWILDTGNWSLL